MLGLIIHMQRMAGLKAYRFKFKLNITFIISPEIEDESSKLSCLQWQSTRSCFDATCKDAVMFPMSQRFKISRFGISAVVFPMSQRFEISRFGVKFVKERVLMVAGFDGAKERALGVRNKVE
ncbi:hypothetical protein D8674_000312 [Pyrus ussuriensis x Pyrus communis]|uniref:Uncharacterized protein n=1 Tax=Pyrus ussuriensis x Pyrus communis TaxID=2448454 RepID=A0A5N5F881_9ROSA|nr:hypothetical protein D8674_000312 [Pyrus ussuriensis x Pyrus communis]